MSVSHTWFGAVAANFCFSKLGATGNVWLEFVVALVGG